ncbi:hypothetical protein Lser_V15G36039 [Lactuca serriola]
MELLFPEEIANEFVAESSNRTQSADDGEPKNVEMALNETSWVDAMHEELNQFEKLGVWKLVDLPKGKRALDTRWVYRNKQDDSGVIVRNKARLVVCGFRQIEGLDYTALCKEFEGVMKKWFEMSSLGEMTMFMGLHVKQSSTGILIHQAKYVDDILEKFGFRDAKTALTPMAKRPLRAPNHEGESVDQTYYRSMIGSLMYLTASRPDIMFAVCQCARFQANPKLSYLIAAKRIFRYLKGCPKMGFWYPKNPEFDLYAFVDSNYGGCELDRKSTLGGCRFLGDRLVSWQCKK